MQYYNNEISSKLPRLVDYFAKGIKNASISHCLLLWGADTTTQCELALEIARLLNCKENQDNSCDCLNCRWIKEQSHPAVKIYTRLDFKDSDFSSEGEDGIKGKRNININQAKSIINELSISSDYHRVYIFCDRDEDGNLLPLNQVNFPEATSNALLKTFEEPPANTTFIFLTKDKSDIISTVVSRAQSFFVPVVMSLELDYSPVESVVSNYWLLDRNKVLDFEMKLLELMQEQEPNQVLMMIQQYLLNIMKSNLNNKKLYYRLLEDLRFLETALHQLTFSRMNYLTVVENLCFKLLLK